MDEIWFPQEPHCILVVPGAPVDMNLFGSRNCCKHGPAIPIHVASAHRTDMRGWVRERGLQCSQGKFTPGSLNVTDA
jgi:hypothetical protein